MKARFALQKARTILCASFTNLIAEQIATLDYRFTYLQLTLVVCVKTFQFQKFRMCIIIYLFYIEGQTVLYK